ncbi:MAG: DUF4411 family protein [Myxococcota bacterium]
MIYILDANVLISAQELFYPIAHVPEFWRFVAHHASAGAFKMPEEVFREVTPEDAVLKKWLKEHKSALVLQDDGYYGHLERVIDEYAPDLNEVEIARLGRDPFLIAAGVETRGTVVTREISKPSKKRANRLVPDVCDALGVNWINDHQLIRLMSFRTVDFR